MTQRLPTQIRPTFELDLEGLRGFAALLVIWCHAIGLGGLLDPGYSPKGILSYQAPAHFCVLIFFTLSGFVIGKSTPQRLTLANMGTYLKKRLLRIYPIYAVCLVLALLVAGLGVYSWQAVIGNFLFLQVAKVMLVHELDPSWSLQAEIVLYLLFIPVSYFRFNAWLAAGACVVLGLVNMHLRPAAPLVSSYSFGFTFWCVGLALSRQSAEWPRFQPSYRVLLSVLLLFLSFPEFSLEWLISPTLLKLRGLDVVYRQGVDQYESMISPHDLAYLPFAAVGVLVFTHKLFPFRKMIIAAMLLVCGLGFFPMLTHWQTLNHAWYTVASACYLVAVGAYITRFAFIERAGKVVMRWLIKIGSISYALYLVHFPLLYAFAKVGLFAGSATTYWLRFVAFMLLSFGAAYWLEKEFQPWARAILEGLFTRVTPRMRLKQN